MSFRRDFYITLITQVVVLGVGALNNVIIARLLGPAGQGILTLVITTSTIMVLFFGGGLQWSNTYMVGKNKDKITAVFLNSIYSLGIISAVLFIIYHLFGHRILSFYMSSPIIFSVFIATPFILAMQYNQGILQGLQDFDKYNLINILRVGTLLAAYIVILIILHLNVEQAVAGWTLSAILVAILSFYYVKRKISTFDFRIDLRLLSDSVKVGSRAILANLFWFLLSRSDMYLVGYFLDTARVGYYSIAVLIAEMMLVIPQIAGQLVFPKASAKEKDLHLFIAKINRINVAYSCFLALPLIIFGKFIIAFLWGKNFAPSFLALVILLPGMIAINAGSILGYYMGGRAGYPRVLVVSVFLSLAMNILLNLIFIPAFGIVGAALSSTLAYILYFILYCHLFKKITHLPAKEYLLPRPREMTEFIVKNLKVFYPKKI